MNRVVVTGLGVVSPIGHTIRDYWTGLIAGRSGVGVPVLASGMLVNTKCVGQVRDFDPAMHFGRQKAGAIDRVSQFAVAASREALAQSGLSVSDALAERTAVVIGTGSGGQGTVDDSFHRLYAEDAIRLHPLTIPKAMVSAAASQVSLSCGTKGPAYAVSSACASATHAIGQAFHMLRMGGATCAICGGAEASITFGALKGWEAMRIMAPDACRPFSAERKGMVIGEGAGIVILEELQHAQSRKAEILAEVVGFGMSADAKDLTAPDPAGMARAISAAMTDARLASDAVGYINAHGTGTIANDEAETAALHLSFGSHARRLAVSSTKSMVGHALGAAGGLEFVATVMALREGIVPPTINYVGPDPACDLDFVPNEARPMTLRSALSNSFAFGGLNAVLAVSEFSG